jgi:CubicO group peptidase (beta-lactamase class C family)
MTVDQQHWRERLALLADKYDVPGASLAIWADGDAAEAAHGVLNLRTGAKATPDSLFQIGSITKVWTATLVMQLVDEGVLDLDAPIVRHLPDFRVKDPDVTQAVTTRHLLAHTSGIDGDRFLDTGRGDDCVAKYVEACADLGQNHPLGATMSYCNAGYVFLGRLLEVLRGDVWDAVLKERLLAPLGLESAGTLPEEALLHGAATGHMKPPGKEMGVAPVWGIFRSCGPAGLIHATARDVLAFARLHLNDGVADNGTRVLSAESARLMREPQVAVPDPYSLGSHWGLSWILMNWDGREVYGHDGGTIGQSAYFRVLPDARLAVCLLTNGGHGGDLFHDLFDEIFGALAGVRLPKRLEPPANRPDVDVSVHAGSYVREGVEMTIEVEGDHLIARSRTTGPLSEALGDHDDDPPTQVLPVTDDVYVAKGPEDPSWTPMVFFRLEDGSPYVHAGVRATPKVS